MARGAVPVKVKTGFNLKSGLKKRLKSVGDSVARVGVTTYRISENSTNRDFIGVNDVRIRGVAPTTNNSGSVLEVASWDAGADDFTASLIRPTGISSIPAGNTIVGVRLKLSQSTIVLSGPVDIAINIAPSLRAWVATEATWQIFSTGNAWATNGGRTNVLDYDAPNSLATFALSGANNTGTYVFFDLTSIAGVFDQIYKGTRNNNGVIVYCTPFTTLNEGVVWIQSSGGTDGLRPIWEFDVVASPDVNVTLTGIQLATSQGALISTLSKNLDSQLAGLSQGAVSYTFNRSLDSQLISLSQGVLSYTLDKAIGSQLLGLSQGAVTYTYSNTLTGQLLSLGQGTLTYSATMDVNVTLSGIAMNLSQSNVVYGLSKALDSTLITTSQGAVSYVFSKTVESQLLSLSQGILSNAFSTALVGNLINSSQSNLTLTNNLSLTGLVANTSQGTLTYGLSKTLDTQILQLSQGAISATIGGNVNVTLSGIGMGLSQGSLTVTIGGATANSGQARLNATYALAEQMREKQAITLKRFTSALIAANSQAAKAEIVPVKVVKTKKKAIKMAAVEAPEPAVFIADQKYVNPYEQISILLQQIALPPFDITSVEAETSAMRQNQQDDDDAIAMILLSI